MIRKAKFSDLDTVMSLGMTYMSNFNSTYDIKSYLNDENYVILVNDSDGVNAFLLVRKAYQEYNIEFIIVECSFRNKGIAKNLMNYFLNNYTSKGDSIYLEVNVNNKVAMNLYKNFEFEIVNKRLKYYQNMDDAYLMKRVV